MNIINILNNRYSTKSFDPSTKIKEDDFKQLLSLLQMSPSSVNLQPWHFVIAATEEGKQRMAKGVQGNYKFNEAKVLNASHVVLFCSKMRIDEAYKELVLESEAKAGRFPNEQIKQMTKDGRTLFVNIHKEQLKDEQHWLEKQVYLNIGQFLLGAAALGIDACPMEGIDVQILDEEFGLTEKGFTAITAVALGYRSESDFNDPAKTPKARLALEDITTLI
ncbi:oxygen-insensitive NAD(P)H nitroreductase [Flavobacterium sp. CBA20B-1]|uniref:oxygen-insensitive NAD(P)H nitroreductase n=1 Tax=unclassified Flavobacterium TaxID=196869 RepID=UPI002223F049|nr:MULTISPECIES: oxygen-insensitive NAD(P)H nitroreductase [unclassified Flavobacterium]WCM41163.1 oxygen-insensitive NAD(P)H nitroreductase [Flavobacterium sp. CBA20B-1]